MALSRAGTDAAPGIGGLTRTPGFLLTAALSLALALVVTLAYASWSSLRTVDGLTERGVAAERLTGQVVQLDEVLTGTALLAAASGDTGLEARYRANVTKLDAVLAELRRIGEGDLYDGADLAATSDANATLIRLEEEAFSLTAAGEAPRAAELLASEEYARNKEIYADGIDAVVLGVRDRIDAGLETERRWALIWVGIAGFALVLTIALWVLLRRMLTRWSRTLSAANDAQRRADTAESERRFEQLTRSSSDVMTVLDSGGRFTYLSPSVESISGFRPEDLLGRKFTEAVHPDDHELIASLSEAARSESTSQGQIRLRNAAGEWRFIDSTWTDRTEDDVVGGMVINVHDVTERVVAEQRAQGALEVERARSEELARTETLLRQVVRNAPLVFYALDENGVFTLSMGRALEGLGLNEGEIVGQSAWDLYADNERVRSHLEAAFAGNAISARASVGDRSFQSAYVPVIEDDRVVGVVGVSTDVSGQARLESELRHRAEHDALTSLANRATFHQQVEHALRFDGDATCVVMIDIDGFKEINDSRGHEAGDRVLAELGTRLRRTVREGDLVARLGGDEFGVLVRTADASIVDALTDRLLRALSDPIADPTGSIQLAASAGVAGPGFEDADVEQALRDADLAMYDAKRNSGSHCSRFDPAMREEFMAAIRVKDELVVALAEDQLVVEYQPLFSTDTGAAVGVEALVRWEHPTRGRLAPGAFMPAAEDSGQITAIDTYVLRESCRQMAGWRESDDPALNDLYVAVNISANDFSRIDLVGLVTSTLKDTGLSPSALVLEITETAAMEKVDETIEVLGALSEAGVRIALDDFGTGYSSLSQLQRLNVDILKVDRAFVADGSDSAAVSLAETIVGLGKLLELQVVAEGIETAEHLETMGRAGCDVSQGFFQGRPMAVDKCVEVMRSAAEASGSHVETL